MADLAKRSAHSHHKKKKKSEDHHDDVEASPPAASGTSSLHRSLDNFSSFLAPHRARASKALEQVRDRLRSDPVLKQRLQVGLLILLTVIVLALQFGHSLGPSSHPKSKQHVSSKSSGSGHDDDDDAPVVGNEPVVKNKLAYEREETGFDVSGSDLLSVRRRYGTRIENEKAQKEAPSRAEKRCLKFAPSVKRDATALTYWMPKKVFDLPVLQRSLKRQGYSLVEDIKDATLVLKGVPRVQFKQLVEGKQYYDMVASLSRIGSKKKTQLATLRNHVKKFGCTFESLGVQPKSWDMNRPSECKAFFEEHEDKGRMIVFKSCKAGEGSKGAGISVTDDLSDYREQWSKCESGAFNYVAQHYIEHPLLIKNRKFDMRVYILVASTQPYIVFFNPGYIRRSLADYKPQSTEKNDVLTNYHVQVTRADFSPAEALWSFNQFMDYLKEEKLCKACGDVEMQLAKIARLVFDAGREYYVRHPGSFQLVGLDFMIDANLRPMFIEGNVSPGLGSHDLKWKKELMDDLIGIMYQYVVLIAERPDAFDLVIGDRIYGDNGNYWQLLVHEPLESCDKKWSFDPCKELSETWKPWL